MKAIHGGKAKTDKIDAHKIALLLRGDMLPQAYVYPKSMRETRGRLADGPAGTVEASEAFVNAGVSHDVFSIQNKVIAAGFGRFVLASLFLCLFRLTDPLTKTRLEASLPRGKPCSSSTIRSLKLAASSRIHTARGYSWRY
jgi:hypothetical protein